MKPYKIISSICLAVALTACAGTGQTVYSSQPSGGLLYSKTVQLYYSGPVLPLEDVGVVSYDAGFLVSVKDSDGNDVKPVQLYGKKRLYSIGRNQYHFLPGTYTFSFGFGQSGCSSVNYRGQCTQWSTSRSVSDIKRIVDIKKGDVIHFSFKSDPFGNKWSVIQKDGSDELPKIKEDYEEAIKYPIEEQHD